MDSNMEEERRAKFREQKRQYKLKNPERVKETQRKWYVAHKAKMTDEQIAERRAYERQWRLENNDKRKVSREKWRKNNPEWFYRFYRKKNMRVKYGLTEAEWEAKFEEQGRCCGICKATEPNSKNWNTDHCRTTGKVRGILCQTCNLMVANHSSERLREGADYVEKWLKLNSN